MMKCFECDKTVQIKKYRSHMYDGVGLENICLLNLEVEVCANCQSETPILRNIAKLHRAIGIAIALQPTYLSGNDIRFLRRAAGYTVTDWASRLNLVVATYSRLENNKQKISASADKMARINYLNALKHKDPQNVHLAKYLYRLLEMRTEPNQGQIIAINAEDPETDAKYLPLDDAILARPTTSIVKAKTLDVESEIFGQLVALSKQWKSSSVRPPRKSRENNYVCNEFSAVA